MNEPDEAVTDGAPQRLAVIRRVRDAAEKAAEATRELIEAMAEAHGGLTPAGEGERMTADVARGRVLSIVCATGDTGVSIGEIVKALSVTRAQARFATERLRKEGMVKMAGAHRGAKYLTTAKGRKAAAQ